MQANPPNIYRPSPTRKFRISFFSSIYAGWKLTSAMDGRQNYQFAGEMVERLFDTLLDEALEKGLCNVYAISQLRPEEKRQAHTYSYN